MADGLTINQAYVGGDYGRSATQAAQPFKGIVFHVTGRPTLQSEEDYMSKPDPNRPGYYGYHYLIDRDGSVYQTAPSNVRTNHIMPNGQFGLNNSNALGVAFVAGHAQDGNIITTPQQMQSGNLLAGQLTKQYGIPAGNVVSHGMLDTATRGPGHGLGGSSDLGEADDFINNYYHSQPTASGGSSGGAGASGSYTPQPSRPGTATPGAQFRSPFDIVAGVETGDRNLTQGIKDRNYDPATGKGTPAQGNWQIIDPTWRTYAPQAGVDINKYPSANTAPRNIQMQVAGVIPVNQWGPDSQNALKKAGYSWAGNQTLGQLQSGALNAPPGTTLNSTPTAATGGPAAPPATGAPATAQGGSGASLPGFTPGSPAEKMAQQGLKSLTGGGSSQPPPPMQLQPTPSAQAVGGPMMMRPGGQNTMGASVAEQALMQRGFQLQPSLAAFTPQMQQQPMMPPGAASGIPGLPGTTLNSPSQLQMALMSGAMNPYDLYASQGQGAGGYGYGST